MHDIRSTLGLSSTCGAASCQATCSKSGILLLMDALRGLCLSFGERMTLYWGCPSPLKPSAVRAVLLPLAVMFKAPRGWDAPWNHERSKGAAWTLLAAVPRGTNKTHAYNKHYTAFWRATEVDYIARECLEDIKAAHLDGEFTKRTGIDLSSFTEDLAFVVRCVAATKRKVGGGCLAGMVLHDALCSWWQGACIAWISSVVSMQLPI